MDMDELWNRMLVARYDEERWRLINRDKNGSEWWNEMAKVRDTIGLGIRSWFDVNV